MLWSNLNGKQNITLDSDAGSDSVVFMVSEIYGWVVPVVSQRNYQFRFLSLNDWTTARIRYSEPQYLTGTEWLSLSTPFTAYRLDYQVLYGSSHQFRPWLEDRMPVPYLDQSGTGAMGYVNQSDSFPNSTWQMVINNINATSNDYYKHTFTVNALNCPLAGCPVPKPPVYGVFVNWSDPNTWPSGAVPQAGDSVVISNTMSVYLDVSPPVLNSLTIEGQLHFLDIKDLTLSTGSIVVFGDLQVGTVASPFQHKATIILNGVRTSPTVIVSNSYFLGNKVLAVFGGLSLAGVPRNVTWTRLSESVSAGSNVIVLADAVDWVVGDEIVITPTTFNASQLESAFIASVSSDKRTVTLNRTLSYGHMGQVLDVPEWRSMGGNSTLLAAAVGLLTRNVVIMGSDINAQTPNYGAIVTIGNLQQDGKAFVGSSNISFVEFRQCGQMGMTYAALTISYRSGLTAPPVNVLTGNAFSYALNFALVVESARNVVLRDNVFHRTMGTAINFDSQVSVRL